MLFSCNDFFLALLVQVSVLAPWLRPGGDEKLTRVSFRAKNLHLQERVCNELCQETHGLLEP